MKPFSTFRNLRKNAIRPREKPICDERLPECVREALPGEAADEEVLPARRAACNHDDEPGRNAGRKDHGEPVHSLLLREALQPSPLPRVQAKEEQRDVRGEKAELEVCHAGPDGLKKPDGESAASPVATMMRITVMTPGALPSVFRAGRMALHAA